MQPLSLSELCSLVEETLSAEFAGTYWVKAEISSLSIRNGHGYFELVEKSSSNTLSAKIRATCWSNVYNMLRVSFQEYTGQSLQIGMQVLLEVEISFHPVYGMSLNIINIDPSYTIGALALLRTATIRRLQEEGVFDLQQRFVLPTIIRRLAVISSDAAAGYEDFVNQLETCRKDSSHMSPFSITLFPAVVQGDRAEKSIISALDTIYTHVEDFDAVVIIRGGGATTDLGCFDNYNLAAHCAQFPIPILSGIGHTKDISVVDMVVHTALKTPTAVASFLVERILTQQNRILELRHRLKATAQRQILIRRHGIEMLRQRLLTCSPERFYRMGYSLLTINGHAVRSIQDVKTGQKVITHLPDGNITSIIQ